MIQRSSTAPAAPEPPRNSGAPAARAAADAERAANGATPNTSVGRRRLALAWWNLLIPALIFAVTWLPRIALIHSLDIVTDENVYIPVGIHDLSLLRAGDITSPYWLVNFEAPALPKLIMGLGAQYGANAMGPQGWLYGARLPGALLAALTLIVAYFLARPIFGRMGATLGALTLALSPWLAFYNAIAYLDTYLLCFMTLAALLTWHAVRRPWLWPLVGALGGLAFASKYTAAFIAVPILLYLAFYSLFIARRLPSWQVALMLPVGLLTAYAVDPAIWMDPLTRLWNSILFEYNHASTGHDAFWMGMVWQHVPPGLGIYILLAKVSLFVTIPALLALLWALWRLARMLHERLPLTPLDDSAAFALAWLGGLMPLFASLTIIVGAHYVLPLAPPVAFTAGWAYTRLAHWLEPRLALRAQAGLAALTQRWPTARLARRMRLAAPTRPQTRRVTSLALTALIAVAMLGPHALGLLRVRQVEGYTAEWLPGENHSLQVAYPAYADAINWVVAHSAGRTTVTLVMGEPGALDEWMGTRQTVFPKRIRLAVGTPTHFPHSEYIIWPEHLVQRQFPRPANFNQLVVTRIQGGQTTYCYILRWPNPDR